MPSSLEPEKFRYRDRNLSPSQRARDLLSRMTLREKTDQMRSQMILPSEKASRDGKAGHVRTPAHFVHSREGRPVPPSGCARLINEDQKAAVGSSRFGIPVLENCEALHGAQWGNATCFPQAIALASTWDTDLMSQVAGAIALELRAVGVRQVFAPVVNIARDPRWGRAQETYGEDPYLTSRMAVAYVKALEKQNIIATPKHFAANVGDGGRDSNAVSFSERILREIYFPAFEACVKEGGARSVMAAYDSINGMPCTCSKWLLTDILRGEWGFDGFTVSDYGGVDGLYTSHGVAEGREDALKKSIEAGLDVELPNGGNELFRMAESGKISEKTIDRAVFRILKAKFELGLFDEPYVDEEKADAVVRCKKHRELALRAARESMVLLKNRDGTLPLSEKIRSLGVFGSVKDTLNLGDYSGPYGGWKGDGVTPLEGIRKLLPEGAAVYTEADGPSAAEVARRCDAAVVFVSIVETEGSDRSSLDLPCIKGGDMPHPAAQSHAIIVEQPEDAGPVLGDQEELIRSVAGTGVPTIVVLINGSPVTMQNWIECADAVLEAWYPGEQGGTAVAETLFGRCNPGGRLPVTFPKTVGQLPLYYNYKPTGRGYGYFDNDGKPLFPFGFGLSYTRFRYDSLRISPEKAAYGEPVRVSVEVENVGNREGDEVVQLYLHDELASLARPVRELKAFRRITLKPAEKAEAAFTLSRGDLAMWNADMEFTVEPGRFRVMIGSSSTDIHTEGFFEVAAPRT